MNIIESSKYKKSYKKILKNKTKEIERLNKIISLLKSSNNLHMVNINPLSQMYHIEQKQGNLKDYYRNY